MNWFRKKALQIQVVRRDESRLQLNEWQLDARLCAMAAKVLMEPNLQLMLSVVKNEHPYRRALPLGASMDDRAVHQARAEGYEMALATLERLAVNTVAMPLPEAVFESA